VKRAYTFIVYVIALTVAAALGILLDQRDPARAAKQPTMRTVYRTIYRVDPATARVAAWIDRCWGDPVYDQSSDTYYVTLARDPDCWSSRP
jgi:hypothetical protein